MSWLSGEWGERHAVPELLESTDMMTLDSGGVELIEVINTELSVRLSSLQDVVDNDQEAVCDRDYGFVARP